MKPKSPRQAAAPRAEQTPRAFDPDKLKRVVITAPLQEVLEDRPRSVVSVVIDLNSKHVNGREGAWTGLRAMLRDLKPPPREVDSDAKPQPRDGRWYRRNFNQYVVLTGITPKELRALVEKDLQVDADAKTAERAKTKSIAGAAPGKEAPRTSHRCMFRVWPNFKMSARTIKSVATVKADAAHNAFSAFGETVVWAVMDSGIDGDHAHFVRYKNLTAVKDLHRSFVDDAPLRDDFGHGTHVAGIIAGAAAAEDSKLPGPLAITVQRPDPEATDDYDFVSVAGITGMAPRARLVSLKILREDGSGDFSDALQAIEYVQTLNAYGRDLVIHGVNLSAGYGFDPEWFACGQSPLCVEIDRLVRSGVVVVVAAGNSGYGSVALSGGQATSAGLAVTIADPGNADLAITVGSTHRDSPHVFGVSYFSSKGPTGDGRLKPDLVAPGERIISCAAQVVKDRLKDALPAGAASFDYVEDSGTSMATPHVSGVIAAFLSIRREFVGRPEQVKEIFVNSATDLKRERYFQGAGLVDLMRAIQSA